MVRRTRVIVIDASAADRAEVLAALSTLPAAVMGDAGYGVEAAHLAEETHPEVAYVSLAGPRERALQTIRALQSSADVERVVAYGVARDPAALRELLATGAQDYLPGRPTPEALRGTLSASADWERPTTSAAPGGVQGRVITVFGAKGGIGKTMVATNLGTLLAAQAGVSVLLMDMDTRFGDAGLMLDVEPRYTVVELAQAVETLERGQFKEALARHESGLELLPAPPSIDEWGEVSADQMHALITFASRLFDYVILDTPGVFNDLVDMAVATAQRIVVMSTLDTASVRNTVRVLEALEAARMPKETLFLTLNHVNRLTVLDRSSLARTLGHPVAVEIPYERQIQSMAAAGQPVVLSHPRCDASRAIRDLGRQLTGLPLPEPEPWLRRALRALWPWRQEAGRSLPRAPSAAPPAS